MEKVYLYGREEAERIAEHTHTPNKELYTFKYADLPAAIKIMREFRVKNGLGMKVIVRFKDNIKLRKSETFRKTYRTMRCPFTGVIFGKFNGMNPETKTARWGVVELVPFREFDLSRDEDAADWLIIRLSPDVEGTYYSEKNPVARYWEIRDERATHKQLTMKMQQLGTINDIVNKMSGGELVNFSRIMGMNILPGSESTLDIIDLKGFLGDAAMKNPENWLERYKSNNRKYQELLYAAFNVNLGREVIGEGIYLFNTNIGMNVTDAINYLRNDKNMLTQLQREVENADMAVAHMDRKLPKAKETAAKTNQQLTNQLQNQDGPKPPVQPAEPTAPPVQPVVPENPESTDKKETVTTGAGKGGKQKNNSLE